MSKINGAAKMVANMLERDGTPARVEAANEILTAANESTQRELEEDFCFCGDHVSLQMVSGGAAKEGYLGRITLKVDGEYVEYVKEERELDLLAYVEQMREVIETLNDNYCFQNKHMLMIVDAFDTLPNADTLKAYVEQQMEPLVKALNAIVEETSDDSAREYAMTALASVKDRNAS